MRRVGVWYAVGISVFCLTSLGACSSDDEDGGSGVSGGSSNGSGATNGSGGANGSGASSSGGTGQGTGGLNLGGTTIGGGGEPSGVGNEDSCDGIDNDGNGVIDDVDVGHDGVCDCLRIATLGVSGTWGDGDVFSTWLDERSSNGAADLNDVELTREVLDQYEVIVAEDLGKLGREYSEEEVAALEGWVRDGGGFMTLIGYAERDERANANLLLAPFGIQYEATPILPRGGGPTVPVTEWETHPISEGVTRVGVDNGYPVSGEGEVVARAEDYVLGLAQESGDGHVFAWADEWITYDSEWSDHPDYQVQLFWVNAIKWLTPRNECQVPIPEIVP